MKGKKFLVFFIVLTMLISTMVLPAFAASYEVMGGDTIYKIADMYGVTVQDIVDENSITNPNLIYPGQMLKIPDGSGMMIPLPPAANGGESVKITIVHTNDIHSRVSEGSYAGMGYDRVATIVKNEMVMNPNTIVMDAGDAFHGQTIATLNDGESIVKIMNAVGYDIMTAGNHDFNYGQERLLELAEMADFPIVCSNVFTEEYESFLPAYEIMEYDGVKVAVFGLATPATTYMTHPDNVMGLTFFDPVVIAKMMVAQLEDEADIIVCLSHLGVEGMCTSEKVAMYVDGIDVIVDGHSHTVMETGRLINDTLIVQAGEYTKNVGIVNLELKDGMLMKSAKLITKEEAMEMEADADIIALIDQIEAENDVITSVVVGSTDIHLDGERADVRTGETNLGNLITDAMLDVSGADIAFTNGGGIRASIDIGDITKGDVITVLPFGNYVVTKDITGAQIVAALEVGISDYPEAKGAFPHIAGMDVVFDPSMEAGSRVVSVEINGEPMDMEMTYSLATNDFMAAGGDGYVMFEEADITGEYPGLDEVLIDYIQENGTDGSPVEGRILPLDEVSILYMDIVA
jgi:2',3'-cyclic-nucleotide 2'-phosphodiesterase (5'-nucleotidase family)